MLLDQFKPTQLELVEQHQTDFKRYLYSQINWDNRLIGLLGSRGVGKTTLLLQHFKEKYNDPNKCLYVLGDDINVLSIGLRKIAREFDVKGGELLIIDEVHKYPNWSQEIKNIYDLHPKIKIIISGSSNINITREKYDLSRRIVTYRLAGMSLREFINFETKQNINSFSLEDILNNVQNVSKSIVSSLHSLEKRILPLFDNYLRYGYYPYFNEGLEGFERKLINVLDKVFHEDIPAAHEMNQSTIAVIKKLVSLIGSSHPFTVDIANIARNLSITRASVYDFIEYLLEAEILIEGKPSGSGNKIARKPSKLYLNNPNLYFVLEKQHSFASKVGTIRETFAFNQLSHQYQINVPKQGDILVDNKYTFEIGGENKGFEQLEGIDHGYVFADGIEYGFDKKTPLWLLGFLY